MMNSIRVSVMDRKPEKPRRGTILVIFMLSLAMLSMTVLAMIRVTLLHRDMVRSNELLVQSEWLFQSAVVRAASRLRASSEYTGEEWRIDADSSGQKLDGLARISVEGDDDQTNARRVAITVIYPPDDARRVTVSRTVTISP